MTLFSLIREYIAALREQTRALNRATEQAAWARYQDHRHVPALSYHPHHGHGHGHAGGNASMPGGCE